MHITTKLMKPQSVRIAGFGHTDLSDDEQFSEVTQRQFIEKYLSDKGRTCLLGHEAPYAEEEIQNKLDKCKKAGLGNRQFFKGSVMEMAVIAAKKCLKNAGVDASKITKIVAGTNTGPGYPSLADHIAHGLQPLLGKILFETSDITEACTSGSRAISTAWDAIRSGRHEKALVVLSEKATTLAQTDDWIASNLFGDAAGAILLEAGPEESFIFFKESGDASGKNLDAIFRNPDLYFQQENEATHRFVSQRIPEYLKSALEEAGLPSFEINHIIPHQPSGRSLDWFERAVRKMWPDFAGMIHRDCNIGNTSSASTPVLLSKLHQRNTFRKGDVILVVTFGAGLSWGFYAFTY